MGRTACTEPQCLYKVALYLLLFTFIPTVLHLRFLYNVTFCVLILSDFFFVFVRVIFTESRVTKYEFRVISNGLSVARRVNIR